MTVHLWNQKQALEWMLRKWYPVWYPPHLPESYFVLLGARCQLLDCGTLQTEVSVSRTVWFVF